MVVIMVRLSVVMKVKCMFRKMVKEELKMEWKKRNQHCEGGPPENRQPRRFEHTVCRTCPSGIGALSA
jgi:hypothetical protein